MKKSSIVFYIVLAVLSVVVWQTYSQQVVRIDDLSMAVTAPQVVSVTASPQYVFTANASRTAGRVLVRTIQNTGTVPVIYAIGSVASASSYHGVLAPGNAARDGLGSVVDLSRYPGQVSIVTESGTSTVCLVELTQ